MNCLNCFNQHLRQQDVEINTAEEIIQIVKSNPFNKGIILGGLEWTLQADEAVELIHEALDEGLEVVLYTGLDENNFAEKYSELYRLPIYIKFGNYIESKQCDNHYSHGVKLISTNQYIKKCGGLN